MENIMLLILGVFISVMGIVNIKGNISTIHSYNRRKVKEEDIPKYGKAVGTGTLIIGTLHAKLNGKELLSCLVTADDKIDRITYKWYVDKVFKDYFH